MNPPRPRSAALLHLPERLVQGGQRRKILLRRQLFLYGNDGFQVENLNAQALADIHFVGVRQQIRIAEVVANRAQQIDRPVARQQIEMTSARQMAFVRPQTPVRLDSENGVGVTQEIQQALDVLRVPGVDQIDVKRLAGAPCRIAASPPTTTNRMSLPQRSLRAGSSLPCGIPFSNLQNVVDPVFQELQALQRGKRKHPPDQAQVHAVLAVIRKRAAINGRAV